MELVSSSETGMSPTSVWKKANVFATSTHDYYFVGFVATNVRELMQPLSCYWGLNRIADCRSRFPYSPSWQQSGMGSNDLGRLLDRNSFHVRRCRVRVTIVGHCTNARLTSFRPPYSEKTGESSAGDSLPRALGRTPAPEAADWKPAASSW